MTTQHFSEDNYLPDEHYRNLSPEADDFVRFEFEGQYYFGYFRDGKFLLKSEGYSSENARHTGIESVRTNMWDDSHFRVTQLLDGSWVLSLLAANHKEIARSRDFETEKEARAHLPSAMKKAEHHGDDYLLCDEYEGHATDAEQPDMARFEKNGEFLFCVYHDNGQVLLRSERYPTAAARDRGFESVVNNRNLDERYIIEEKAGKYFLVLKAGNHQEIARSCPFDTERQAAYWLPSAIQARMEKTVQASKSDEDNYLACDEYKHKLRSQAHPDFMVFAKDDEFYFGLMTDSGEVLLRSEGYTSETARNNGIESVVKNIGIRERYTTEERFGKYFVKLHAANNREIARSCPETEAGAAALINRLIGPDESETVAEATAMLNEPIPVEKPRMNIWPWILLILAAILLFIWFRSCNTNEEVPPAITSEEIAPAETAVGLLDCQLMPILFAFDSDSLPPAAISELKEMAGIMKNHPGYTGKIMAFTDSVGTFEYNKELSRKRCEAARNILVNEGVDAGRIEIDPEAELEPVAINTEDDSGRHFNRRLELMIYDANGDPACVREEMDIPEELKIK